MLFRSDARVKLMLLFSVTNKVTLHACESAQQQVALVASGTKASDTVVNLLISNVGVLNVNTNDAGITSRRAVAFMA